MDKYEWLWKTMKQHKQDLVNKFESQGKPVPIQHKSTLDVMNYLEVREQALNRNLPAHGCIASNSKSDRYNNW